MKIRCSRCGKRFDADVYSGLCPKCGAYNGKHMAGYEEAVNEREKTEKTWRQEQQKAEQAVSESRSRTDPKCGAYNGKHMAGYEEAVNEREKTEKTWRQEQQKAEQAVSESRSRTDIPEKPKAAKQTAIKQKAGAEGAWKMLAAALLIPIAAALVFQIWKNIYFQERISAAENIVRESGDAEITVIEGENMEYPVYTAVLGMEQFASDEVPEGWHLEGICIASSSNGYNSREQINDLQLGYEVGDEVFYQKTASDEVPEGWHLEGICIASSSNGYNSREQINDLQLGYEVGDEVFYQKTVSRYDLEYMIDDWGIDANEILSEFDFNYGESLGYLIFMVRDGAENRELILELDDGISGSVSRQANEILSEFDFNYGESLGYLIFMVRDGAENRELILELDDGISGSVSRQVSIALDDVEWFVPESGVEE